MKKMMISKENIEGPVVPLNIPFNDDDEIDYDSYERYVDWLASEGVPVILLTYGSSEYGSLTDDEIYKLTKIGAEANAGRSIFTGSTKCWPVSKCLNYIEYAEKWGAESVKIQPDYWRGIHVAEGYVDYYVRIANSCNFPLWLYALPNTISSGNCLDIISRTSNYIAMKNDADAMYGYYDYIKSLKGKIQVVSGGQMKNMLYGWQFGAKAYLCPVAPFYPKISLDFIRKLKNEDYESAKEIIRKWEDPIIEICKKYNNDFLNIIKTILMVTGHYRTNIRRLPSQLLRKDAITDIQHLYEKLMMNI